MLKNILFVGLGGALGSIVRYAFTLLTSRLHNFAAMTGTFIANVLGCFVIGLIIASCERESLLLFASVGFCGGFTTFSTFSVQTLFALQSGKYGVAITYIAITLLACLLITWAGMYVGKKLL